MACNLFFFSAYSIYFSNSSYLMVCSSVFNSISLLPIFSSYKSINSFFLLLSSSNLVISSSITLNASSNYFYLSSFYCNFFFNFLFLIITSLISLLAAPARVPPASLAPSTDSSTALRTVSYLDANWETPFARRPSPFLSATISSSSCIR